MTAPTKDDAAVRWHGDLLAVDPGLNSPGAALFRHGILVACDRVCSPKSWVGMPLGERCLRVAFAIAAWADCQHDDGELPTVRTVVYEWPQIYRAVKSKGDPNDLTPLVGVGQSVAVLVGARNVARDLRVPELITPTPAEWTGQLPKATKGDPWASPRGARVRERLAPGERVLVPDSHDAIDALGLGLWALGRYDRVRVFPGAV